MTDGDSNELGQSSLAGRAWEHLKRSSSDDDGAATGGPVSRAHFRLPLGSRTVEPADGGAPVSDDHAAPAAARRNAPAPAPRLVIDQEGLRSRGFLTPATMRSHLAQEIRHIKQEVLHTYRENAVPRANMIMVTSACPGEGKTFNAMNLAISLACERDLYVLLVDADAARPQVSNTLGIKPPKGLLDVLREPTSDLSEVIFRTDIERLSIIGAGDSHDMSVELLGSERMRQLVDEISERYADRLIIFDAPPVLATVEPTVLAKLVGQILVVVEANRTDRRQVEETLDLLQGNAEIGLILNKGTGSTRLNSSYYGSYYDPK